MRFASIVGARPQFVKIAPVSKVLRERHQEVIIHTGQHYDYNMSAQFFQELSIPTPDYHLECGSGTHGAQTARMLEAIETVLIKEHFDCVIVYGDTNSTLAGALAAAKLHIPIAHIEAGLRSFNRSMPEEVNRIITDHLSERLFCPTPTASAQLRHEGITQGVEVVGDVMYDMLLEIEPTLNTRAEILLSDLRITPQAYILVTVHRAANTDDPVAMHNIVQALNKLEMPVLFAMHPRTRARMEHYNITYEKHIQIIDPVGYLDMVVLERAAYRILTDSGGVQKEAFFLGVPCVTLREETEWVETVQAGWNTVSGTHWPSILDAVAKPKPANMPPKLFGDGNAAYYIAASW